MAREVRIIARIHLANAQSTISTAPDPAAEIDMPRDELIWPVDPSAQIDIYSGIVMPATWDATDFNYSSSNSSLT